MSKQWSVEFDVSSSLGSSKARMLRGTAFAPDQLDSSRPVTVLYCIAGGGCTAGYFDLEVAGHAGYSMARHLADRGYLVVAVDNPGVGASTQVDDVYALDPWTVASAHHNACQLLVARIRSGSLGGGVERVADHQLIGVGHSMGGMLVDVLQGVHRPFDAVIGLGQSGLGLPQFLNARQIAASSVVAERRADVVIALAREMFADPERERSGGVPGRFFAADVPTEVRVAFAQQQTTLLYACGLAAMIPGFTRSEKAAIEVPVFLGLGDEDLVVDGLGSAAFYTGTTDLTVFTLIDSGHCHNQASSRAILWNRLDRWIRSIEIAADDLAVRGVA